jgi:WD40 repeat protein
MRGAAFSGAGGRVISGCPDGTVKMWAAASGRLKRVFDGQDGPVFSVAFSPDGKNIIAGAHNSVTLWNAGTGALLRTVKTGTQVNSAVFSPDGRNVLVGGWDMTPKLWRLSDGKLLRTFRKHAANSVTSVAFSPDGRRALSGSHDKTLMLWDARTGGLIRRLEGHGGAVWSVVFSPDGKYALSGSSDKSLRLWDVSAGGRPAPGGKR